MDNDGLARVTKVDLRTVWAHEQTGFSRWLVENIDFLNEQLPFDIDPESLRAEAPAGDFSVDVVGDAALDSGESIKVIVENQLEQTDHRHLGQVLTYVAAYSANAAIWITAEARPEHAKAVQWLNDEANIDAWLFDVEIIQIDESRPAPTLTRIVGPSDLSKKAKADRQTNQLDRQQQKEFWSVVLPKVATSCAPFKVWGRARNVSSVQVWESVPNSPGKIGWQIWVSSRGSWICVRIDGETADEVDHYFNALSDKRIEIDSAFGPGLVWDPLEGSRTSVIRWDNPTTGGYRTDPDVWSKAGDDVADAMRSLVVSTIEIVPELPRYEPPSVLESQITGPKDEKQL